MKGVRNFENKVTVTVALQDKERFDGEIFDLDVAMDRVEGAALEFNANNELTAAISVVGTRLQINEEYRDYLAGKAIACARDISRLLGWKSPFDLQAS